MSHAKAGLEDDEWHLSPSPIAIGIPETASDGGDISLAQPEQLPCAPNASSASTTAPTAPGAYAISGPGGDGVDDVVPANDFAESGVEAEVVDSPIIASAVADTPIVNATVPPNEKWMVNFRNRKVQLLLVLAIVVVAVIIVATPRPSGDLVPPSGSIPNATAPPTG